ncbi:SDR family NAD(P)-dependent oxidoreductase [Saccharopolyspora mangrovi]|uniref:SDR family NAD(P)-dependent oxidoreductase n=1 Tax=Saccharopolyspora mangrovi TaxID=3082379 RepID=A0ABU6AE42_9PSEU|nr:SDR family NAD(P)-dependent oxidoreductase [Saccharopolyspora sp. S2-29]MEB3369799.1 SDR family NAD(P)-dependent oxidoreductase [Saccharopolyspora sp. S2-29]
MTRTTPRRTRERLEGKAALVTGAAGGIGKACAEALAAAGTAVHLVDQRSAASVAPEISGDSYVVDLPDISLEIQLASDAEHPPRACPLTCEDGARVAGGTSGSGGARRTGFDCASGSRFRWKRATGARQRRSSMT